MDDAQNDELLTTAEAAALLDLSENTLEVWRTTKRYPLAYVRVGRNVRYTKAAIYAFLRSRHGSRNSNGPPIGSPSSRPLARPFYLPPELDLNQ